MAHELAKNVDGKFMYAFKGDRSAIWHDDETNGVNMPDDATADEMLDAAGYGFKYRRAVVRYPVNAADSANPAAWKSMPDRHVLVRSDTNDGLCIVSDRFELAQPSAMRELARLIAKTIDGSIDSAGITFNGIGMFINIRAGAAIRVCGQDVILPHFLLATKNDGTMNSTGKASDIRAICWNTTQMAIASPKHARDFRLSHRNEFEPAKLAAYWAANLAAHQNRVEQFKLLSQTPVQFATAENVVFELFNDKRADDKKQDADATRVDAGKRDIRNQNGYKMILGLFNGTGRGAELPGVRGTAWGLFNAVSEFADHHATAKSASHRWENSVFGPGADMKASAFGKLLKLATAE